MDFLIRQLFLLIHKNLSEWIYCWQSFGKLDVCFGVALRLSHVGIYSMFLNRRLSARRGHAQSAPKPPLRPLATHFGGPGMLRETAAGSDLDQPMKLFSVITISPVGVLRDMMLCFSEFAPAPL